MCGVHLKSKMASAELNCRLGIDSITELVIQCTLQRFGNVERKGSDDLVSACSSFEGNGVRDRGRGT